MIIFFDIYHCRLAEEARIAEQKRLAEEAEAARLAEEARLVEEKRLAEEEAARYFAYVCNELFMMTEQSIKVLFNPITIFRMNLQNLT